MADRPRTDRCIACCRFHPLGECEVYRKFGAEISGLAKIDGEVITDDRGNWVEIRKRLPHPRIP
jgi:hypothetical protein